MLRLAACVAFCALTAAAQAAGIFDVRNAVEFSRVVDTGIPALVTNATVNYWLEGPVWVPTNGGGYLLFSSMGSDNRLKKLVPPFSLSDFLVPSANTLYNGSTLDAQERLITCQSGTAGLRVVMVTNGVVTPLVSTCAGLKFYSPNDVIVKSDGTIWFTDPGFNGVTANPPQPGYQGGHYVYWFDPANGNGTCTPVITNVFRPNGLCFSPDESRFTSPTMTLALFASIRLAPTILSQADRYLPTSGPATATRTVSGAMWMEGCIPVRRMAFGFTCRTGD